MSMSSVVLGVTPTYTGSNKMGALLDRARATLIDEQPIVASAADTLSSVDTPMETSASLEELSPTTDQS